MRPHILQGTKCAGLDSLSIDGANLTANLNRIKGLPKISNCVFFLSEKVEKMKELHKYILLCTGLQTRKKPHDKRSAICKLITRKILWLSTYAICKTIRPICSKTISVCYLF